MKIEIKHIYCGKEKMINDGRREVYPSSYKKLPLNHESYCINEHGFELDHQSDKESHGGVDKAVCVYSLDDYEYFEKKLDTSLPPCAFGENLSVLGINDSDICIGDQFTCGEVLFEVSQPRQPCWKISSILGIKKLTAHLVQEHKTGFYFRVLKNGKIKPSSKLELIARPYPKLSIKFINQIYFNAKEHQENIKKALTCNKFSTAYKEALAKRYKHKEVGLQTWQKD